MLSVVAGLFRPSLPWERPPRPDTPACTREQLRPRRQDMPAGARVCSFNLPLLAAVALHVFHRVDRYRVPAEGLLHE